MKKSFYVNDIKVPVIKCKRPKFSYHGGRTWDFGYIYIDGVKITLIHLILTIK